MWVIFTVIGFFLLALLIPVVWSLGRVWRRTEGAHAVTCPAIGEPAVIAFDQWYAVRMHACGDRELKVIRCSHWPERQDCVQACVAQLDPRG